MTLPTAKFKRRALLGGACGLTSGALLPFVPVLDAEAQNNAFPLRLCFITVPNGIYQKGLVPTGTETNFEFGSVLKGLEAYKQDLLYLHGVDMGSFFAKPIPNDHPPVAGQLLTANEMIDPKDGSNPATSGSWFAAHPSIDQVIAGRLAADPATRTKFPSIVAGVQTKGLGARQVYTGSKDPISAEVDPVALFERTFNGVMPGGGTPMADDPAVLRRRAERKSIIDGVAADLATLQQKLGQSDRQKIDSHLERLRSVEQRLQSGLGGVSATCSLPARPSLDIFGGKPEGDHEGMLAVGEAQMATLAHAFACDLTRVATLQWRSSAAVFKVPRPDGSLTAGHHALSHSDYTPQVEADLDLIAQWYAARLKTFLDTLKAMPEGNGSVLDNTLVVWTSEHSGAGDHDRTNIPFLLAGSLGGKFKTGRFLSYNKAPHADLYVAIANAMGLTDMTTFGMAGVSKGPLPNLS